MPAENNSSYRLTYKTARGTKEDGHAIGWVMGWVEENKHPYFFVVNLESADPNKDLGTAGLTIAKGILQQRHGLTEEEAYLRLRNESRRLRRPMKELAEAIILAEDLSRKTESAD